MLVIVFSLGLRLTLGAERYPDKEREFSYSTEDISQLAAKVDVLSGADKEILKKLDRILSNQEKIFGELAIIKVRASKK